MAIQVARALGAHVIATAGSQEKCRTCTTLGAVEAVNYREQDFVTVVKRLTGGNGVDVILDTVGGLYAERNLDALATEGRLVHISAATEPRFSAPLQAIMQKRAIVTGSLLRPLPLSRKLLIARQLREHVWHRIGSEIRPVIDSVYPLAKAADAHRRMESGQHSGKILLKVDETAAS
jgi:NADPH2:quinone reductase